MLCLACPGVHILRLLVALVMSVWVQKLNLTYAICTVTCWSNHGLNVLQQECTIRFGERGEPVQTAQ